MHSGRLLRHLGREARVRCEAAQRLQALAARRATHQAPTVHRHLPDAEPRVGDPLAADILQVALPPVRHDDASASPGTSLMPRASNTDRSTASGTASWASASGCSGAFGGRPAGLTPNTPSPSTGVP